LSCRSCCSTARAPIQGCVRHLFFEFFRISIFITVSSSHVDVLRTRQCNAILTFRGCTDPSLVVQPAPRQLSLSSSTVSSSLGLPHVGPSGVSGGGKGRGLLGCQRHILCSIPQACQKWSDRMRTQMPPRSQNRTARSTRCRAAVGLWCTSRWESHSAHS
jgi:hypothetical protein